MEEFARFLAVADLGNVTRAAETLNISQPALSRSLALLEQRFRTTLFTRGPNGVELTGAGQILYDNASRALRLLRDAEERIDYEGVGGNLSLSICAGDSWGNAVLPPILHDFMENYPAINVRLDIIGSEARMAGLAAGNYDLSYGIALPMHERLGKVDFIPMLRAPYIVYCAADHPLRNRDTPPSPEELRSYGWVRHKFEYDHDPARWQETHRTYAMSTNTMLSTLEMVRRSTLLIATSEVFRELFARHDVHDLGPDPLSAQHISGLHRLRGSELSSTARLFATFCAARFSHLFAARSLLEPGT